MPRLAAEAVQSRPSTITRRRSSEYDAPLPPTLKRSTSDATQGVTHLLPYGDMLRVDESTGGGRHFSSRSSSGASSRSGSGGNGSSPGRTRIRSGQRLDDGDSQENHHRHRYHDDKQPERQLAGEEHQEEQEVGLGSLYNTPHTGRHGGDGDGDDYNDHHGDDGHDENCGGELMIHDDRRRLQWSIKFFENLHMDLSPSHRDDLRQGIERLGRDLFEEHFRKNNVGNVLKKACPKTREEDPSWSPIVDVEHISVPVSLLDQADDQPHSSSLKTKRKPSLLRTKSDARRKVGTSPASISSSITTTTTNALIVIHRLAYEENGEEVVMGRFLLPLRRGLYEIIVIAADDGLTSDDVPELTMTTSSTSTSLSPLAIITDRSNVRSDMISKEIVGRISPDRDGKSWDEQYPDHCLSRVRRALKWLVEESEMVVSDPPNRLQAVVATTSSRNSHTPEWDLSHIHCRITPPSRFLPCPNPDNPESNKYRFCRATLGGTGGVEMMVVSCWYGAEIPKGNIKQLRKVAVHAANVIHESQQLFDIKITAKEVALGKFRHKHHPKWLSLSSVSHPKDAVITTVDCYDAQGRRKQNTIGWVRESISGNVYLVYMVDTLRSDPKVVRRDLATTLASVRVPRLIPNSVRKKLAWHATSSPALLQTH